MPVMHLAKRTSVCCYHHSHPHPRWGKWWEGCMDDCFRCPQCPGVECCWYFSTSWLRPFICWLIHQQCLAIPLWEDLPHVLLLLTNLSICTEWQQSWLKRGYTTHTCRVCPRSATVTCTCVDGGLWSSESYSGPDVVQFARWCSHTRVQY